MTIKELVSKLAAEEGKKHQASVGDIRELLGLISDIVFQFTLEDGERFLDQLARNGRRRAKRKKR